MNKILAIGMCTTNSRKQNYLMESVDSIVRDALSSGYIDDISINVQNCDHSEMDPRPIVDLRVKYGSLFDNGTLNIFTADEKRYPIFEIENPTLGDTPHGARWRSKLAFDGGLLIENCMDIAPFYLHMDDDILFEKGFFNLVFSFIYKYRESMWSAIQFGKSGSYGYLFRSSDLGKLSTFVQLFYDDMPLDFLFQAFLSIRQALGYQALVSEKCLLKHIGVFSSNEHIVRPMSKFG